MQVPHFVHMWLSSSFVSFVCLSEPNVSMFLQTYKLEHKNFMMKKLVDVVSLIGHFQFYMPLNK